MPKRKYTTPELFANAKKTRREAAEKDGARYFTVDGVRFATATGERAPLSIKPSLEALQRRIDYERTLYGDTRKNRLAKE